MSYWSNGIATLHHSDAREMPIESNSVHCVVTSPPYYGLRKYRADEELVIGDESTPEKYVESIVAVFNEVYRVLRDDGMAWLNLGDSYSVNGTLLGIPWRVAFALQDNGWTLRSDVIWAKKAPMPESVNGTRWERCKVKSCASIRAVGIYNANAYEYPQGAVNNGTIDGSATWEDCTGCDKCNHNDGYVLRQGSWRSTSSHEHIFQLTKGMNYYSDGEAVKTDTQANRRDVWRDISPEPYAGEHFATFPPDLPRLCIQASTSEAGVCGSCGNQWARVVEHTNMVINRSNNQERSGIRIMSSGTMESPSITKFLGWKPTCDCNSDKIPATVLDPFAGTGTTLLAAQRLGRSGIGVDLSEDYLNQAIKRLSNQTLPMVLI